MIELSKMNAGEMTAEQIKAKKDKELRNACAAFEGMFMDMMMKTMRKASMESSLIKKSNGEKIFTEMLDQQYVDLMAKSGSSGLGNTLYRHLKQSMPEYRDDDKNINKQMNPYFIQKSRENSLNDAAVDFIQ